MPAPTEEANQESEDIELPETPAQKYLAGVWSEVLEIEDIGINDTFFDIGGHSLLVMKVITQVHERTQVKLGPQEFLVATLEQMANKLEGCEAFASAEPAGTQSETTLEEPTTIQTVQTVQAVEASVVEEPELKQQVTEKKSTFRTLKGFWD